MPCKSQLVSKVRYNKLPEFRERNKRKKKKKGENDARLSGGTKNYALTRDSASRYFCTSGGHKMGGKKKEESSTARRSFVHENWPENELPADLPLIKTRSERTKARRTLSSLNGVLISDGLPISPVRIVSTFPNIFDARGLRDISGRE